MDPVIPCPNDDNAVTTRKSSKVKDRPGERIDLFGISKIEFIASPVSRTASDIHDYVVRPDAGQGVITVYGFFTPLRITIKCCAASHISAGGSATAIRRQKDLCTPIHVLFTELA
jgi:hypothetical protein